MLFVYKENKTKLLPIISLKKNQLKRSTRVKKLSSNYFTKA